MSTEPEPTPDASLPTAVQALAAVMADIAGVAKNDRNKEQGYSFRGVDAVVNAVGPALRKHGVMMMPHAGIPQVDKYETKKGTVMTHVVLPVSFTFHGPAGDVLSCEVYGESSDAGDKVLSKAHSVAYRVALLEVFCIPTDDPEPDSESHERASEPPPLDWFVPLGWESQSEYDSALEQNRTRASSLPDPQKLTLKAWLADQGWKLPYEKGQMEGWADRIDELDEEATQAREAGLCEHCGEKPCVCAPDDEGATDDSDLAYEGMDGYDGTGQLL